MTDNEIIKALECCANKKGCANCEFNKHDTCISVAEKMIYGLVERQQAEIKKKAQIIFIRECEINALQNLLNASAEYQVHIRAEAIQDFAERLKEQIHIKKDKSFYTAKIDNIMKEMGVRTEV